MDYFEFRQQLLKDSFTKDEEFHRLRKEDLRCAQAYVEAMEFEKTLKQALRIKPPETLKDSIVLRQTTQHHNNAGLIRKYAIAATVFLSFVIATAAWYIKQPGPLETFVVEALMQPETYMSEEALPQQKVDQLFASLNTKIDGDIGQVHFLKKCKTPGGLGARMVLMTDNGPVTLLYMPKAELAKRVNFNLKNYKGTIVAMDAGAIAIIGENRQQLASAEASIQNTMMTTML